MRRRDFVRFVGGAVASTTALVAQAKLPRVGVLFSFAAGDPQQEQNVSAFVRGLEEFGWIPDRNVQVDFRFGGGDRARMQGYAAELVAEEPDVLFGNGTAVLTALRDATGSIPIVFVHVAEPVSSGFVQTLARPGGNITGFTNFEPSMVGKWLELLKEVAPLVTRVAVIYNPSTAPGGGTYFLAPIKAAAPSLGLGLIADPLHTTDQLAAAFASLAHEPGVGFVVMPEAFTTTHRALIVSLAADYRLPGIYPFRFFSIAGGLISYGVDSADLFWRGASYVDRILRGERPGELPVQAPSKFELVVNQGTAQALGLTIPPSILLRADEVIE
jgi:putative tryptophan/tyrosine transport system substrate-binding protein